MIFFFFNAPATTEIYTLSLHDALPISSSRPTWETPRTSWPGPAPRVSMSSSTCCASPTRCCTTSSWRRRLASRSEEHTSELQSRLHLVCRLLLEKKKKIIQINNPKEVQ